MKPTVSIITPTTYDRAKYNDRVSEYANSQDYPNIIEHIFDYSNARIGTKRNRLCIATKGDIIVHFDSDDHYSPEYISKSVEHLIKSQSELTGLSNSYFYHKSTRRIYLYRYNGTQHYVLGATFVYWKHIINRKRYQDINNGEDNYFLSGLLVKPHPFTDIFLSELHGKNVTAINKIQGRNYTPVQNTDMLLKFRLLP